jgi:hypothetical protein
MIAAGHIDYTSSISFYHIVGPFTRVKYTNLHNNNNNNNNSRFGNSISRCLLHGVVTAAYMTFIS